MIIVIIAFLIHGIVFGALAQYVAESKGYDRGFAWGFWLGLIGLLVVGFRPAIIQPLPGRPEDGRKPRADAPAKKPCPYCGAGNNATNEACFACGQPLKEEPIALLEKLGQLHQQGVLTDEEFQQKKAEILAKL